MESTTVSSLLESLYTTFNSYLSLGNFYISNICQPLRKVLRRNYIVAVPIEFMHSEIDEEIIRNINREIYQIIESHILIPSKYCSGHYQSLNGRVFKVNIEEHTIECCFGLKILKEMKCQITEEDIYYAPDDRMFHRMLLDQPLDERFYMKSAHSISDSVPANMDKPKYPIAKFESMQEFE